MSLLPIFVSQEAWIEREWLREGFALWQSGPLAYARDYFLCLPSPDFQSTCQLRARYSDAKGFSLALLSSLACLNDDSAKLLFAGVAEYWSEHSDRSGLDTWLAALGVPGDARRFVGRWSAKGSEDAYVRSSHRVVELSLIHISEPTRPY